MVATTRRGARAKVPEDDDSNPDSSSDNASIPAQPVRRRGTAITTPATLRPSREPTSSRPGATKRKRDSSTTSHIPPQKRQRRLSPVRDSIEVQEEDEDDIVDAAINATSTRSTSRLEIQLPIRRHGANATTSTEGPSRTSTTRTAAGPPRSRRIGRRINSVEVFGAFDSSQLQRRGRGRPVPETIAETPEPEGRPRLTQSGGRDAGQALESPELQSSALKRRRANHRADIYDVPEDEEPELPSPVQRPKTINGLESLSRSRKSQKQSREARRSRRDARLSLVLEEEQQWSDRPEPRHEARTVAEERDMTEEEQNPEESEEPGGFEEPSESEDEGEAGVEELPSVAIQASSYNPSQGIISVSSAHPNHMSETVGKSGWTGAGRRWRADLIRSSLFEFGDEPPAQTRLGRDLFKSLSDLKDKLDDVPNALDLVGQARFLAEHSSDVNLDMSSVESAVLKIKDQATRARSDQGNQIDPRYLDALANDLSTCVIPMLVLVLHASFAIGAQEPNAESNDTLPPEGAFTQTTVQYMLWITSWLIRLQETLTQDLARQTNSIPATNQLNDPENPTQSRERFGVMVRKWRDHLKAQVEAFNEEIARKRDIHQKKQRDMAIKRMKEQAEERQLEDDRRYEQAVWASWRELGSLPRPMAERWHKATAQRPTSGSSSSQTARPPPSTQHSTSSLGQAQSRSHTLSASGARAPQSRPQPQRTPAPLVLDYPPWPEVEVEWFLGELNRPDRGRDYLHVCAESLDRPLEQVRTEMERLRRVGLYRPREAGRGV